MNILLVEDDDATIESLQLCFSVFFPAASIFPARMGQEALEILAGTEIDIMLVDLGLPDMDGMDLVRKVRQRWSTPIVVVSARHSEDNIAESRGAGADDYILKPFDYKHLIRRIRELTGQDAADGA